MCNALPSDCKWGQDARDTYFPVAVGSLDPVFGSDLAAELPGLEAAGSALAAVSVELASIPPKLQSCKRLKSLKKIKEIL